MTTTDGQRPVPAEDITGYLRSYNADAASGTDAVEEVWERYHTPDGVHLVNGRPWDLAKNLKYLTNWRKSGTSYELYIHEAIVEGRRAAVRYTISVPMLWKLTQANDVAIFYEFAEDGRVASSTAFTWSKPGWSGPGNDVPWDEDARATGAAPAPPAEGEEPSAALDPARYLRRYAELAYDPQVPVAEAHDLFHTPDALHYVGGHMTQRSGLLQSVEEARKKGHTYVPDIQETLREGNRFAARHLTAPDAKKSSARQTVVFTCGECAEDGRVRLVRSILRPGSGTI